MGSYFGFRRLLKHKVKHFSFFQLVDHGLMCYKYAKTNLKILN